MDSLAKNNEQKANIQKSVVQINPQKSEQKK